ncbi:rRNA maturation RNase YbeY [bacterium]|nr:rRNA maturation RNase YbeY [bacterium]
MLDFPINNTTPTPELNINDLTEIAPKICADHSVQEGEVGFIFVETDYIIKLNQQYFDKSTPTDVISFLLSDPDEPAVAGEVYVCTDTARIQAKNYSVTVENELLRLAIHGLLHVLGYDDQTSTEKTEMTQKEDFYLEQIFPNFEQK